MVYSGEFGVRDKLIRTMQILLQYFNDLHIKIWIQISL